MSVHPNGTGQECCCGGCEVCWRDQGHSNFMKKECSFCKKEIGDNVNDCSCCLCPVCDRPDDACLCCEECGMQCGNVFPFTETECQQITNERIRNERP